MATRPAERRTPVRPGLAKVGAVWLLPHPNEPQPLWTKQWAMGKRREHQGGKLLPPCLPNYTPFFAKTTKADSSEAELEPTATILDKGRSILNDHIGNGNRQFDHFFC